MAMAERNSCDIAGAKQRPKLLLAVVFSELTDVIKTHFLMKIIGKVYPRSVRRCVSRKNVLTVCDINN